MTENYAPPFTPSAAILYLVAEIAEQLGKLSPQKAQHPSPKLRRIQRIRTIQGSLAIEGNTLSEEQITAILDGKRVLAPPREIKEVQNALDVYDQLDSWNPNLKKDMLKAHRLLMASLLNDAGSFRSGGVGVMKGGDLVHMAPPASMVPTQIMLLLRRLKQNKDHPLIASSIFHYEVEFIYPFADGNGRMGRLWQTLILSKWNPLFAHIPVENLVHQHQKEYYKALEASSSLSDAAPFVEFMLQMILDALNAFSTPEVDPEVTPEVTPEVRKLLKVLKGEMSRSELMKKLRLKDEKNFRLKYVQAGLQARVIERTIPDKPNSRLQKYRLSESE